MARQRNVQQQNEETLDRIRETARRAKEHSIDYRWLTDLLAGHGLQIADGILADEVDVPGPGGYFREGIWVSRELHFYSFDVWVSDDPKEIEEESWLDVTSSTQTHDHQPGTGRTFGSLALEVLAEELSE